MVHDAAVLLADHLDGRSQNTTSTTPLLVAALNRA